jgi:hypothetical protein
MTGFPPIALFDVRADGPIQWFAGSMVGLGREVFPGGRWVVVRPTPRGLVVNRQHTPGQEFVNVIVPAVEGVVGAAEPHFESHIQRVWPDAPSGSGRFGDGCEASVRAGTSGGLPGCCLIAHHVAVDEDHAGDRARPLCADDEHFSRKKQGTVSTMAISHGPRAVDRCRSGTRCIRPQGSCRSPLSELFAARSSRSPHRDHRSPRCSLIRERQRTGSRQPRDASSGVACVALDCSWC